MAVFIAFLAMGGIPGLGAAEYPVRVGILGAVIWLFSRPVLDLRMLNWIGSVVLGLAVFVVWVAPDVLWPGYREHWLFQNSLTGKAESSVPTELQANTMVLIFRAIRATLIVPIVEELFWRGWLMRWLISNDFTSIPLGTYARDAFWITAALFAVEHGPYWEVGLLAGVAYNWWMVRTKSLGDCILAHAVTNGVLSAYTVYGGHWQYW
jgi:CAAX prenyl protease-like protein